MSAGAWGDLYSHTLLEGMHNYPDTLENSHTPTIWPMSSTAASYSLKEKKQCPYIAIHDIQLCVCAQSLSRVQLFGTPWAAARQAPLSMGFSRQEYWSGLPCPPPGDLPNPGIEPRSPALQVEAQLSLKLSLKLSLIWKQSKCPSMGDGTTKLWNIFTVGG